MGEQLAAQAPVEADMVMGVPESGVPAAEGFAHHSGIPLGQGLVKNRYIGRSFIAPSQELRARAVRMKLNPLKENIAGKRLVVIDDSIVRGTTQRALVRMLREAGATEVHLRISSPPVMWSCFYGIDTGERSELIAYRYDVDAIRRDLDADTLAFLDLDRLVTATGAAEAGYCDACFTGHYPVEVPVSLRKHVLEDNEQPLLRGRHPARPPRRGAAVTDPAPGAAPTVTHALVEHLLTHSVRQGDFVLKSGKRSTVVHRRQADDVPARGPAAGGRRPAGGAARRRHRHRRPDHGRRRRRPSPPPAVAATRGRMLRGFSVRKETKGHGGGGRIAGALEPGDKVAITEDAVTRGVSMIEAAEVVREPGAEAGAAGPGGRPGRHRRRPGRRRRASASTRWSPPPTWASPTRRTSRRPRLRSRPPSGCAQQVDLARPSRDALLGQALGRPRGGDVLDVGSARTRPRSVSWIASMRA